MTAGSNKSERPLRTRQAKKGPSGKEPSIDGPIKRHRPRRLRTAATAFAVCCIAVIVVVVLLA